MTFEELCVLSLKPSNYTGAYRVVTWSVLVTRQAFFGVLQESAGGLGRGRSGTLQRDSNNVPVTEKDACSDLNRVSIQTVTMITRILVSSPSWESAKISPGDCKIDAAAADWTAQTRMMWRKVQNVTFIRGNDTSSACVHVPSRVVRTDLSRKNHTCTQTMSAANYQTTLVK